MQQAPTLIIKKYGNRRLYDSESSQYITMDQLAETIRSGRDVQVVDAKTGADLTKSVLLQIIADREKDHDLLPVSFLKKVIQHGDPGLRDMMRRYLSVSLDAFLQAQKDFEQRYRNMAGNLMSPLVNPLAWMFPQGGAGQPPGTVPPAYAPHVPGAEPPAAEPPPDPGEPSGDDEADAKDEELRLLKEQMAAMQAMLVRLTQDK